MRTRKRRFAHVQGTGERWRFFRGDGGCGDERLEAWPLGYNPAQYKRPPPDVCRVFTRPDRLLLSRHHAARRFSPPRLSACCPLPPRRSWSPCRSASPTPTTTPTSTQLLRSGKADQALAKADPTSPASRAIRRCVSCKRRDPDRAGTQADAIATFTAADAGLSPNCPSPTTTSPCSTRARASSTRRAPRSRWRSAPTPATRPRTRTSATCMPAGGPVLQPGLAARCRQHHRAAQAGADAPDVRRARAKAHPAAAMPAVRKPVRN